MRALFMEPQPVYSKIAPGISIDVRPTVLRDGASARLQMDANFGIDVTQDTLGKNQNSRVLDSVPAPVIKSHRVQTDAAISALDLFEISSFSIEASHPRSRYLPVIGSIPVIGEILKRPPKNKTVDFESLILVNAVILPRAMDVARLYQSDEASPPPAGGATPQASAPR